MRLRVAARASDLARIQAHEVVEALRNAHPGLDPACAFRDSQGDRNDTDPLWAMADKGVFTEDFVADLMEDRADLVVHSWKDLPIEPRTHTVVAATLPRADNRDVLLVRRDRVASIAESGSIEMLTSSPRRAHSARSFLRDALPVAVDQVTCVPVRGNVPTRMRKLLEGSADALIVAKAALDRLLGARQAEFGEARRAVRECLDRCRWMVLPIRANPSAPGQGALAIEVLRERGDLRDLFAGISDAQTYDEVERERATMRSYGGGCHQAIGVSVLTRPYGRITSLRGTTDAGDVLDTFSLESTRPPVPRTSRACVWPLQTQDVDWFGREPITTVRPPAGDLGLWVARSEALPAAWAVDPDLCAGASAQADQIVWASGLETWKRLARRGVWVNGCAEGLGEGEDPRLECLVSRPLSWVKLTHDGDAAESRMERLATYRLVPRGRRIPLADKTHFFWTSASGFLMALEQTPEIREGWHACGPGNTYRIVERALGSEARLRVALSHAGWLEEVAS